MSGARGQLSALHPSFLFGNPLETNVSFRFNDCSSLSSDCLLLSFRPLGSRVFGTCTIGSHAGVSLVLASDKAPHLGLSVFPPWLETSLLNVTCQL